MSEREIFLALLELPDSASRWAHLDRACGNDPALRARVAGLLWSHEEAGSFLGRPAVEPSADPLAATESMTGLASRDAGADAAETLARLSPPTRPGALGRVGHYELLEVLGQGGFGTVFRAFDDVLQRVVAVKVLAPQLAATSPPRWRFLREARSAAAVRHENVVQTHAVEEEPLPYLVMEFIPGETLQQRLDRAGPCAVDEVVAVGRQIALGLAAAHAQGLIHRDVKPGNVLIESGPGGRVKLTDFGLARAADDASLTQSGLLAGTPLFMSPEQAAGETLDFRSDLFSLGSVLYTMCAGHPPFRGGSTLAVLKRVAEDTPRPLPEIVPEVPPWLCAIVARLHAKAPDDRYASASEVAELLAGRRDGPPAVTNPATGPGPASAPPRDRATGSRRRIRVAAGFVLCLVGLGFTEARGITDVGGTIIRLLAPGGTLVVEVDDPGVRVSIDGEDLVITGAGAQEIRLRSGPHAFQAMKDGKVLREEVITVASRGRRVVRVSREAGPGLAGAPPSSDLEVQGVEGAAPLAARLKLLNPGFTGLVHLVSDKQLVIRGDGLTDISPVLDLPRLGRLECTARTFRDLAPIGRLNLWELSVRGSQVSDLGPLKGMRLTALEASSIPLSNLWPLQGMPLTGLSVAFTAIDDLTPLRGMKLRYLNCEGCQALTDLSPLAGLPLRDLLIRRTRVADLSPLREMKLVKFDYREAPVQDISPLRGMPLEEVSCDYEPARDEAVLRGLTTLKVINDQPAADFWKAIDGG